MNIRVYLAAAYTEQARMREVRNWLSVYGYDITSSWIDTESTVTDKELIASDPTQAEAEADRDIQDLIIADTVVLFTDVPSTTGGRHVELGIALAQLKHIVIVGPIENVFQALPGIFRIETMDEFQEYVRSINAASKTGPAELPAQAKRETKPGSPAGN